MPRNIQWNFLTPYLTPLSRPMEGGVRGALQLSRFNRSFDESNRRYNEGAGRRNAELEKMMMNNARMKETQKTYNWANSGTEGSPLPQASDPDRLFKERVINHWLNVPQAQREFITTSDPSGVKTGRYVEKGTDEQFTNYPAPRQPGWTSERDDKGIETSTFGVPQIGDTRTKHPMPAQGAAGGQAGAQQEVPDLVKTAQSFVLKFAPMLSEPSIQGMLAANPGLIENPAFMSIAAGGVPPEYQDMFKGYMAILKTWMEMQVSDIPASQGGGMVTTGDDFMKKHGLK